MQFKNSLLLAFHANRLTNERQDPPNNVFRSNMSMGDKVILSAVIGGTAEELGSDKPDSRSICEGGFTNVAVTKMYS